MLNRLSALLAALSCVVLIAACGSSKPSSKSTSTTPAKSAVKILNTKDVAKSIEATIKSQRHITATVTCPSGIVQKQSVKFTCIAKVKGIADTPFEVTQTDNNGAIDFVGQ